MADAIVAAPNHNVGEVVSYTDRNDRQQAGTVLGIDATWHDRGDGKGPPLIIYRLQHPTYRNGHFYTTDQRIRRSIGYRP